MNKARCLVGILMVLGVTPSAWAHSTDTHPPAIPTQASSVAYKVIPVTEGGVIEGRIVFQGPVPKFDPIPVTKDPQVCGKSVPRDQLVVGPDRGLPNTVIFIEGIPAGKPLPNAPSVTLDQKNCMYEPRILTTTAGATLVLKNSDPILHTVHATWDGIHVGETAFNIGTPKNAFIKRELSKSGMIGFMCDVGHRWMGAYLHIFPHPYFAVTGPDGKFRLENVPSGTYTVKAWHEGWKITGEMADMIHFEAPKILEQKVVVSSNKVSNVEFTLGEQ